MSHYCNLTLLGVSNEDFLCGLSTVNGDNLNGFCTCMSFGNCLVYRFSVIFFSPDTVFCPAVQNFALNKHRLAASQRVR